MATVDFHCHSNASDGMLAPEDVVARAAERGVKVLALTDHDGLAGLPRARGAAEKAGITLINGVEISANWSKHTLHIVGLGVDDTHPLLVDGLIGVRGGRPQRARKMAESLAAAGIPGALEGALTFCDDPNLISRSHFARWLVANGHVKDLAQCFKRFMIPGKPGFVAHDWATLPESIEWIRAAGGVAVLAHPGRYDMSVRKMRELLGIFKELGGDGIEVATGNHTLEQVARFAKLAQEFDFWASQGSDFHGKGHYGELGAMPTLPSGCRPVWHAPAVAKQIPKSLTADLLH